MAIAPTVGELLPDSVDSGGENQSQPWPSEKWGFYALFCIIFATFVTFFDQTVFGMLSERMKASFHITDATLGILQGPVTIVAYVIVGIPLARLVDIFPRKFVLGISIAVLGSIMALGGLAQSFRQLVGTRLFVGAASSANGPGSYSLLVDSFRPYRIPLVFALLQLGFIGGTSIGAIVGGQMIGWTSTLPEKVSFLGMPIFNWQLVLLLIGAPGLLAGLLYMFAKEPPRRSPPEASRLTSPDAPFARKFAAFMGWDALKAIWARKAVFVPLFAALAMSAVESQGMIPWRVPLMARTYGWNEAETGALLGTLLLVAMLAGIAVGGMFVTWMSRRYTDANIRATTIIFACTTVTTILMPLMPTGELSIAMMAIGTFFGLAGAPAQNAAIQRIAPNEMRGQVSAFYLFMFTFFAAIGSWVIGAVSTYIVGDESQVWKAVLIVAAVFLPTATFFMWRGIKPYRVEVERLEKLGM
jgi:MFS family permease